MIITKVCSTCEHYPNDKHCIGCEWDKSKGENTKWELKENPIVIERAVLDKIRAEIDQITDTMGVSYNQYISKIDVLQIIDNYKAGSEDQK